MATVLVLLLYVLMSWFELKKHRLSRDNNSKFIILENLSVSYKLMDLRRSSAYQSYWINSKDQG